MTTMLAPVAVVSTTIMGRARDPMWSVPLAPLALALTAGIVVDRLVGVLLPLSCGLALACLAAWWVQSRATDRGLAVLYLWGATADLGCAYHQWYREVVSADDIRHLAAAEARPVRVAGVIAGEPIYTPARTHPLQTFSRPQTTKWTLSVERIHTGTEWAPISGLVQATVTGTLARTVHVGDEVEVIGNLSLPPAPANPGEFDYADYLRDQRIGAVLAASASPESVVLVRRGWPASLFGWLGVVRGWAKDVLQGKIDAPHHAIAWALLLGDGSGMTGDDWDVYLRTGVIHVLAISGQHLVVLAGFLWFAVRLLRMQRWRASIAVAVFLLAYALLTGARPPVMRAAWTVLAYCGGMMLGRRVLPANVFALAWIGVLLFNPTDAFNTGCQLSFLAVAVLYWGTGRWRSAPADPLQQVIEESRPLAMRLLLRLGRWLGWLFFLNLAVWLAVTPLAASRFHMVSPVALLIGPAMVLLTSIALLAGFFLLLTSWLGPLCLPFAWLTQLSLAGCDVLVHAGANLPGAYFYVADIPDWWLWIFYSGLAATLTVNQLWQRRWLMFAVGMPWVALAILLQAGWFRDRDFRCTFLAVGHGGCTVIETTDGKVILYDAGAVGGPDLTRRHIAPYLWRRGYRTIDEVMLSHADLDHFNGLIGLLERFSVRSVALTPSFAERPTEPVRLTMAALAERQVPTRIVRIGDHWEMAGVAWQVLHPPPLGPEGKENARSLVAQLRYQDTSILLTGDLEEPGLSQVLARPIEPLSVLMAPHHGSLLSNTPKLAKWARPQVAISNQGPPIWNTKAGEPYEKQGTRFLTTWWHGAVTIRSDAGAAWVETYRTRMTLPLRPVKP